MTLDWFEAWRYWAQGVDIGHTELYGLSMLWWGRIGKGLQFIGGLTVVLDLVGSDRLRLVAKSLRDRTSVTIAQSNSLDLQWKEVEREARAIPDITEGMPRWLVLVVTIGVPAFMAFFFLFGLPKQLWATIAGWVALSLLGLQFLTYIASLVLRGALHLIVAKAVGGIAWLFDAARPGHPMRWISVALIVSGFTLDMLSS